jgi:type I restriction enzyme S subunit
MDKEIKERVAAINSGIIPEGYKKTKVGIVPWGWEVIKAKEVFSNISNKKHNGDLEVLSSTQDKGIIPRSILDIDIKYDKESTSNYKCLCQ